MSNWSSICPFCLWPSCFALVLTWHPKLCAALLLPLNLWHLTLRVTEASRCQREFMVKLFSSQLSLPFLFITFLFSWLNMIVISCVGVIGGSVCVFFCVIFPEMASSFLEMSATNQSRHSSANQLLCDWLWVIVTENCCAFFDESKTDMPLNESL